MADAVFLVAATLMGATIGSYLNVVIYRMPRPETKSMGARSACPTCRQPIPGWLNIPVLSWLLLRGRSSCCKERISVRYPLVEALTALLFFLLAAYPPSGLAMKADPFQWVPLIAFVFHAYFIANLVANTFIDIDFRILPDRLTKPLMVVGVIGAVVVPTAVGGLFPSLVGEMSQTANSFMSSALGLVTGFGITWAVRALARIVFGQEAMGFGDVKLMGGVGAFLGWQGALLTFLLGCIFGSIGGGLSRLFTRDPYVAFGPYLALGAVVTLFASAELVEFFTETWPRWQQRHAESPLVLLAVAVVCLLALLYLVRRGRSSGSRGES